MGTKRRLCKRGHVLDEVGRHPGGGCAECSRRKAREWKRRKRAEDPEWREKARESTNEATRVWSKRMRSEDGKRAAAQLLWDSGLVQAAAGYCMEYRGKLGVLGYGYIKTNLAHRLAYESMVGSIPEGRTVHHRCENKRCVNPNHLIALTRSQHRAEHHGLDGTDLWGNPLSSRIR